MSDTDVVGWVFDDKDGGRWAVQADSKEAAMEIFTKTAPSETSIIDEHTIPSADATRYQLELGKAVKQAKA
jgi:hypothetical protein